MELIEIERSIIKKYRKEIWSKFVRAISDYELVSENDSIAVCISGGKDSFLLAKLMQELKKHGKVKFDLKYIVMNPGYSDINKRKIEDMADKLNIPIEIFDTDIFEISSKISDEKPCYMCARMRRGYLYSYAKKLGCNKIALGHHFDDVIETILLNIFYGAEIKTMMPKLKSKNFEGLELIRPMYMIKENDISSWCRYNELEFINCACKFTEEINDNDQLSKRLQMKKIISQLREEKKNIDYNIFKSLENINLDNVISYRKDGEIHSFLDEYSD